MNEQTLDTLIAELQQLREQHGGATIVKTHEVRQYEFENTVDETSIFFPEVRNDKRVTHVFIGE